MSVLKNGIPSEHYYKLLEWKDKNSEAFDYYREFLVLIRQGTINCLSDLREGELRDLYKIVFKDTIPSNKPLTEK